MTTYGNKYHIEDSIPLGLMEEEEEEHVPSFIRHEERNKK